MDEYRRTKYKYNLQKDAIDPFSMAVYENNLSAQFTSPKLSPLNSEDAMERYQAELMKSYVPEIRIPSDFDKMEQSRGRFKQLYNAANNGGTRSDYRTAYHPELEQTNKSTFYYPGSSSVGLILPNHVSKGELNRNLWNLNQRLGRQRKQVQKQENTHQENDFLVDRRWTELKYQAQKYGAARSALPFEIPYDFSKDNREKCVTRSTEALYNRNKNKDYDHEIILKNDLDGKTTFSKHVIKEAKSNMNLLMNDASINAKKSSNSHINQNRTKPAINKTGDNQSFRDSYFPETDDKEQNVAVIRPHEIKSVFQKSKIQANVIMAERVKEVKKKIRVKKEQQLHAIYDDNFPNATEVSDAEKQRKLKGIKSVAIKLDVEPIKAINEKIAANLKHVILPDNVKIGAKPINESLQLSNEEEANHAPKLSSINSAPIKSGVMQIINDIVCESDVKKKDKISRHNVYSDKNKGYRTDFGKVNQELNEVPDDEYAIVTDNIPANNFADTREFNRQAKMMVRSDISKFIPNEEVQNNSRDMLNNEFFGKEKMRDYHKVIEDQYNSQPSDIMKENILEKFNYRSAHANNRR